ncbi:thermopsin family protease [Caldisphaera sp.]|uniref:thermopsin family protease n=1 Tax=Caldisphaera sp. TaxID=2060322 RepID=UPI003D0F454E
MIKLILIIMLFIILMSLNVAKSTSVGINDNGTIVTNNGTLTYGYSTNGLLGIFNFYNGSFYSLRPSYTYGFSLQLNANVNISLNTTLWIQSIARISNIDNTYKIEFLDNVWNVTQQNTTLKGVKGNGNIYNNEYYAYEYPETFVSKTPFTIKEYVYIKNSSHPIIEIYFNFINSTYQSGETLLDKIIVNQMSNNPVFLIGQMGGSAPQTVNSLLEPFVLQFVVAGYSKGSQLLVFKWHASMKLFYLYNNSWYIIPSAYQDSPTDFAGGTTLESVNMLNGINEYFLNNTVIQINGNLNQSALWTPSVKILNSTNYTIELNPPTLWDLTIIGNNFNKSIIGNITNITLIKGKYLVYANLKAGGKTIESFFINLSSNNTTKFNTNYLEQFNSLIYISGFIVMLLIIAIVLRKIKKNL